MKRALTEGYIEQGQSEDCVSETKRKSPTTVHRFDLGQNSEGCAPQVAERLKQLLDSADSPDLLKDYPENGRHVLQQSIASLHDAAPCDVLLTAGIEQAIGLIANAFLRARDRVLLSDPTFYIFENFSARLGAQSVSIALGKEREFNWDEDLLSRYRRALGNHEVRIIWIANPNNPTGKSIPRALLGEMIDTARKHGSLVVVDEAYGEYTDPHGGVCSASSLLSAYKNLVVLRTFSKAYGLANLRIGYALSKNAQIIEAIKVHSYNFPISGLAIEAAIEALNHLDHLETTRRETALRIRNLINGLNAQREIVAIPSDCSIFMVRHGQLCAAELHKRLLDKGIATARIPGTSAVSEQYIRVTCGKESGNTALIEAFREITNEVASSRQGAS